METKDVGKKDIIVLDCGTEESLVGPQSCCMGAFAPFRW